MITRSKKSKSCFRRQSVLICQWCFETYMAERSDSKYCCNSHKTLASNARQKQKNEQERIADERRRQLRINQQKVTTANKTKSTLSIPRDVQEPPPNLLLGFEKTMKEILEKSAREMQLRDQKLEMEGHVNKFVDIAKRMQSCFEDGYIRYSGISELKFRVSRILGESALRSLKPFQKHIEFIEQTLAPYLEELRRELRDRDARRLTLDPPMEITFGLELLSNSAAITAM